MNIWNGIGNLTKEPELKYTTGTEPMAVCNMTVAINDGYGDKKRTSFIDVVVFGKVAENCERYLNKGSKIGVQGRIQTDVYERKDGTKAKTFQVVADKVEFLTGGNNA